MELVTFIIAIIGCITGILGAILNTMTRFSTRKNLKVKFIKENCFAFPKIREYKNTPFENNAIAYVVIENRSSLPITVISMKFKAPKIGEYMPIQPYELDNLVLYKHDGSAISFSVGNHQLSFPLTLAPYQAVSGFLFFKVYPYSGDQYQDVPVLLTTTRHCKNISCTCRFQIYDLETFANNRRPSPLSC